MHKKATYNLAVGLTLRELQDERQVDRARLAEALQTSELDISKIENGSVRMTAGELILMMELFDLEWADFLTRITRNLPHSDAAMI